MTYRGVFTTLDISSMRPIPRITRIVSLCLILLIIGCAGEKKDPCAIEKPSNPICPPLQDNPKYKSVDSISYFDKNSLIIYFPKGSRMANMKNQKTKDSIELWTKKTISNVIKKALENKLSYKVEVPLGTMRKCPCKEELYIYENQYLPEIGAETASKGSQTEIASKEGGSVQLNYILQSEMDIPAEFTEWIVNEPSCITDHPKNKPWEAKFTDRINLTLGENKIGHIRPTEAYSNTVCTMAIAKQFDSDKTVVAFLDTGLDQKFMPQYSIYENRISPLSNLGNDYNGWNFVDFNKDISDGNGHGTIVALSYLNGLEKLQVPVDQQLILPVKVLNNCGSGTLFDITCGLYYAIEKKASIVNMSLGATIPDTTILQDAILAAKSNNIVIATSAGNKNKNLNNYSQSLDHYPSAYSLFFSNNVFEVGASCLDTDNLKATDNTTIWNSSISSGSNFRTKMLIEGGVHCEQLLEEFLDLSSLNGYTIQGTSMAAPLISAALLKELSSGTIPSLAGKIQIFPNGPYNSYYLKNLP